MSVITTNSTAGETSHELIVCPSGRKIIRFDRLNDLLWYDRPENNPNGIGVIRESHHNGGISSSTEKYLKERFTITDFKKRILSKARQNLAVDKDFQELIHKSKSDKRKAIQNKYGGNFLPTEYAKNSDYMFERHIPGKKATTLNMAFQVGMLQNEDYSSGFVKILKTILMAQAMNIRCNIDMFDSDTAAVPGGGYIIVNVAKSTEKVDFNKLLISAHEQFFHHTLFNGYSAQSLDTQYHIGTFLYSPKITQDLSPYYEVIGGNFLPNSQGDSESRAMVSQLFKIAWK